MLWFLIITLKPHCVAVEEPVGESIKYDGCDESTKDVDQVVSLDVDGGTAQEEVERQCAEEERTSTTPKQQHEHGAHTHMARWEGRCRTFARLLCGFYQIAEESIGTRRDSEFCMIAEVVAQMGKVTALNHFLSHGMEVILRSCHGQEEIDQVIEKEAGEHDVCRTRKLLFSAKKRSKHSESYERIVGKIAHMEEFAPKLLRQPLSKRDRGLTPEEGGIGCCEHVVEIGKQLTKLIRVGIPIA